MLSEKQARRGGVCLWSQLLKGGGRRIMFASPGKDSIRPYLKNKLKKEREKQKD
jgi:hypothetical protein